MRSKTSLLELKPKRYLRMFSQIWLWVDPVLGLPIQTRLTESSGDFLTFQLENIKINPKLQTKSSSWICPAMFRDSNQ